MGYGLAPSSLSLSDLGYTPQTQRLTGQDYPKVVPLPADLVHYEPTSHLRMRRSRIANGRLDGGGGEAVTMVEAVRWALLGDLVEDQDGNVIGRLHNLCFHPC